MAVFSVLVMTAAPPGLSGEVGGAYVKIDGREALLRSVELFLNREGVKQIQLAVLPDMMEESKRKFGAHLGFSGVKLLSGGPKWADQIKAGAEKLSPEATHVIVHDGARPAVPFSDIDTLMEAAEKADAATLAAPVRTQLVEVDEGGSPMSYHPPASFMQVLTPQAFSKQKFAEMASSGKELHPSQVRLIKGSSLNVRLGGGYDASLVKEMTNMLPKPKVKPPSSPFEEAQW